MRYELFAKKKQKYYAKGIRMKIFSKHFSIKDIFVIYSLAFAGLALRYLDEDCAWNFICLIV